jgi:hypothetical protein
MGTSPDQFVTTHLVPAIRCLDGLQVNIPANTLITLRGEESNPYHRFNHAALVLECHPCTCETAGLFFIDPKTATALQPYHNQPLEEALPIYNEFQQGILRKDGGYLTPPYEDQLAHVLIYKLCYFPWCIHVDLYNESGERPDTLYGRYHYQADGRPAFHLMQISHTSYERDLKMLFTCVWTFSDSHNPHSRINIVDQAPANLRTYYEHTTKLGLPFVPHRVDTYPNARLFAKIDYPGAHLIIAFTDPITVIIDQPY